MSAFTQIADPQLFEFLKGLCCGDRISGSSAQIGKLCFEIGKGRGHETGDAMSWCRSDLILASNGGTTGEMSDERRATSDERGI